MRSVSAGDAQARLFEANVQTRSRSFERSPPEGDDGNSTPLGHRSRSPFLTGPGKTPFPRFLSHLLKSSNSCIVEVASAWELDKQDSVLDARHVQKYIFISPLPYQPSQQLSD